jgi:hypothetical protein
MFVDISFRKLLNKKDREDINFDTAFEAKKKMGEDTE